MCDARGAEGREERNERGRGEMPAARGSMPFVFFFLLFSSRAVSLSLSTSSSLPPKLSLQVVEASSSVDDSSSSDSEGAVATPAAGKKEVSIFLF